MATNRESLQIDIQFENVESVSKKLQTLLGGLKGNNIKIDLSSADVEQSLKNVNKEIDNLGNKLKNNIRSDSFKEQSQGARELAKSIEDIKNATNKPIKIGDLGVTQLEQRANEIRASIGKITDISFKTNAIGELDSAVISYKDNVGNVVKETMRWVEKTDELGNLLSPDFKTTGFNIKDQIENVLKQQEKAEQQLNAAKEKMQGKLNTAKNNGFIDTSVLDQLQQKLNSLDSKNLKEMQNILNNLGSTDSGIVRLQNGILKMESTLTGLKGKYGNLVGDKSTINQLQAYEAQIAKLKAMLDQLKNGGVISGTKISAELNKATNAGTQLSNAVKESSNAFRLAQKDATSLGDAIKRSLGNVGIYLSTATVVSKAFSELKEGINYVIQLDNAMTDLKKVTDESKSSYDAFLSKAHEVSMELGTQSDKMVQAVANWAKAGESFQNAQKLAENTMLFTRVGDNKDVEQAQMQMVAPLKAFNLTAEESIGLIDRYNNISNNSATTTNDLGEALRRSASAMAVAGNNLDETLALVSMAQAKTQLGGETIGNAFKTISLRLATMKTEEGEIIPKLAEDLDNVGVKATDSSGQLKSTFDVLTELSKVFNDLDRNTQMSLLDKIAGKRQANVLAAVLSDSEQLAKMFELSQNSAGSAMQEFDRYKQSVQYSVDQLKEQMNGFYTTLIDDSALKGFIDITTSVVGGITGIIDTFGLIPTAIASTVSALSLFSAKFRESFVGQLPLLKQTNAFFESLKTSIKADTSMTTANTVVKQANTVAKKANAIVDEDNALAVMQSAQVEGVDTVATTANTGVTTVNTGAKIANTVATTALTIAVTALQAVMTFGLALIIPVLVGGFIEWADSLVTTKEELKELNQELESNVKDTKSSIESAEGYIKKIDELNKKIAETDDIEKRKELTGELNQAQKDLATAMPESANGVDANGNLISTSIDLTKQVIELKKHEMELDAQKFFAENQGLEAEIKGLQAKKDEYNQMVLAKAKGQNTIEKTHTDSFGHEMKYNMAFTDESMKQLNQDNLETVHKMSEATLMYGVASADTKVQVDDLMSTISEETSRLQEASDKANETGNNHNNATDGIDAFAESVKDATKALEDEADAFDEHTGNIKILEKVMEEFSKYGFVTEDTYSKVLGTGNTDMIAMMGDSNNLLENAAKLKEKYIGLQEESKNQAIEEAMALKSMVDSNANEYGRDAKNKITAEQLKGKVTDNVLNNIAKSTGLSIDQLAEKYGVDLTNKNNSESSKNKLVALVLNDMAKQTGKTIDQLGEMYGVDVTNFNNSRQAITNALNDFNQKAAMYGMTRDPFDVKKSQQNFDEYLKWKQGPVQPMSFEEWMKWKNEKNKPKDVNFNPAGYNPIKTGYVPVGSSVDASAIDKANKDRDKANKAQKKANEETYKPTIDIYKNINAEISENNALLNENRKKQSVASGKDLINLKKEEINLLIQQKKLEEELKRQQTNRLNEITNKIKQSGGVIDGNIITNYKDLLDKTAKGKDASNALKELEKLVNEFYSLNDAIDKTEGTILDLSNSINKINKDLVNTYSSAEQDIYKVVEYYAKKRVDAKTKEIDEIIDQINRQYDAENKSDDKAKKQNELADLQAQINNLARDSSAEAKAKMEELQKEYNKLLAEFNKGIQETVRDETINDLEQQKEDLNDKLDEYLSPENISKIIADAMSSGVVDLMGSTVELSTMYNKWVTDTKIGNETIKLAYDDLNKTLQESLSIMQQLSSLNNSLGLNFNPQNISTFGMSRSGDMVISLGSLNIPTDGVNTGEVKEIIRNNMEQVGKQIKKELNKSFKNN